MSLEMAYEQVLTNKSAIALVTAENASLVVVELVSEEMIRTRVALSTAGLVACVPHLGGGRIFAHHDGSACARARTGEGLAVRD